MSELNIDSTQEERARSQPLTTNVPLMIALACGFLLLALFVAALQTDGQNTPVSEDAAFGSVSGHVIVPDKHQDIGGVRVVVKRVHAGVANFYFDRMTAADGSFEFKFLLPGRYTIEIDPRTVPDAIFAAASRLTFVDVAPSRTSNADLAIARSSSAAL